MPSVTVPQQGADVVVAPGSIPHDQRHPVQPEALGHLLRDVAERR